jgi:hypothetical protein
MRHRTTLVTVVLLAVGLGVAPAATASPGEWQTEHGQWGEITTDTCGVPGLRVQDAGSGDSRSRTQLRGGLPYQQAKDTDTDVYTNLANGEKASVVEKRNQVAVHVTDNGDGTLTIIYLFTGNKFAYDGQGNVIGHAAGSVLVKSVWDDAGTISDQADDTPLSFTFLRKSGTKLDFCGTVIPAIT